VALVTLGILISMEFTKKEGTLSYPVVELTKQLREELNLPDDFLVLNYEINEYLILYKVSKNRYSQRFKNI